MIGVVIGGGIFMVPNLVARSLPSAPLILAVWIFAGFVSLIGALACAELGAAFPATGGQYVFLREAYGPFAAFLCGWSMFTVARCAQVSWLSVVFSMYAAYFFPLNPLGTKMLSLAILWLLAIANYLGVKVGARIQNIFTFAKIGGALVIIASAFLLRAHSAPTTANALPAHVSISSFGVALIATLLCYDGWVQLSFVAGEIRDPQRNVVRALSIGMVGVCAVYLLCNFAYLRVLTIPQIASSEHVGADAATAVLGQAGGMLVSVVVLFSVVGTLNGCFLTIPRVYYAQALDGLFFRKFAEVHPRFKTPGFAIVAQGMWATVLVLTGSYESLIDYALFGIWIFYSLMIAGVIVLRRTRPDLPRPYKMWGYPVTPILFLAVNGWFLINTMLTRPRPAIAGLLLTLTGVPAYFLWQRYGSRAIASPAVSLAE